MIWQWLLFFYIGGFALTGVALAITAILAFRYHKELPKKPILESIEALEERKRQTEKDYDALRDRLAAALHDIEEGQRWHKWLEENEARIGELKREEQLLVDTESKLANVKEDVVKQEETLRQLREREAGLKVAVADYDEKTKRIEELRKECSELQIRKTQQGEELARLEGQSRRTADELAQLQKVLEPTRADLQGAKASLAETSARLEQLSGECKQKDLAVKALRTDIDEKSKLAEALRKECGELKARSTRQAEEVTKLDVHLNKVTSDLTTAQGSLQKVKDELEKAKAALNEVTTCHGTLTTDCHLLETKADHLRKHILELTRERETIHPAIADASARVASIWEPVLSESLFNKASPRNEVELLRSVAANFLERGMNFHDRVIRAFHTALKIANESPLVVLAGISGTGKSALPRLYAEAMGLHFLNVAVQPSWDSPMDMLGFFNHLEGRFRSTELTRAMVQMDSYGWDDDKWPAKGENNFVTLHDRMLLVLLDEMNLARVEYYFSEFLSKLEFRRDIDPGNPEQRQKAEIMLETGASGAKHQLLPIYPGTNVLFVGTMNEDESTQTLSDKVVDRANVLRFGMPADLKIIDNARKPKGSPDFLPYQKWQEWLKQGPSLQGPEAEKVETFVRECNKALEPIGKPFAYRTANAIRAYVRHYPRLDSEAWLHHALADQVEQKVMPKLRGIDLQDESGREAIDRVRTIVKRLEDKTLEKAIDEGGDVQHGHQFVWRGIDRAVEEEP